MSTSETPEVRVAQSDAEIAACFPVMRHLRTHLDEDGFVERVREQERDGYHLAFLAVEGRPVAVAGYRLGRNLAWGRFLYVDDLVTDPEWRSGGCGATLLNWLKAEAEAHGCEQLHLDSGTQREDAHRFYTRERMDMTSLHFQSPIPAPRDEDDASA
jgi:GNAT superfamily N-acetyltransferase